MLDHLLSPIVIAGLAGTAAAALSVSVIFGFIRERDLLDERVRNTERALKKIQSEIADRQIRIKQLKEEVQELQSVFWETREYHESLLKMQAAAEQEALQEAETDEAEREREKRRRRMR